MEQFDAGKAVDFPGVGLVDALDRDATDVPDPDEGISMIELVPKVAQATRIDGAVIERGFTRMVEVIDSSISAVMWSTSQSLTGVVSMRPSPSSRPRNAPKWSTLCGRPADRCGWSNATRRSTTCSVPSSAPANLPSSWSVSRFHDRIQPGDSVVFWVAGKAAGVYALGEIASEPFRETVEREHAVDPNASWTDFVEIDLYVDLFDDPCPAPTSRATRDSRTSPSSRSPRPRIPTSSIRTAFEAILDRVP